MPMNFKQWGWSIFILGAGLSSAALGLVDARIHAMMYDAFNGDAIQLTSDAEEENELNQNASRLSLSNRNSLDTSPEYFDARVAEAKANVSFHESKVESARIFVEKIKLKNYYQETQLRRAEKLQKTKAISIQRLEAATQSYEQGLVDMKLFESNLRKEEAELRAAQARLKQILVEKKVVSRNTPS